MVLGKKSPALPCAAAGAHPAAGSSKAQGSQSQKLPRILCWRCPALQGHPCCGNVAAVQPERFAQDPAWIFTSFAPIISIGTFFIAGSPAASFAWWKQTNKQTKIEPQDLPQGQGAHRARAPSDAPLCNHVGSCVCWLSPRHSHQKLSQMGPKMGFSGMHEAPLGQASSASTQLDLPSCRLCFPRRAQLRTWAQGQALKEAPG